MPSYNTFSLIAPEHWGSSGSTMNLLSKIFSGGPVLPTNEGTESREPGLSPQCQVTVPACSDDSYTFQDGGSCVHSADSSKVWRRCGSSGGCTDSRAP